MTRLLGFAVLVLLLAVVLAVLFVLGRAAFNAWRELGDVVRTRRARRNQPGAEGKDVLETFTPQEIQHLSVEPERTTVWLSRLSGWSIRDPRLSGFTMPEHLLPVYANKARSAADAATAICEMVMVLAGAFFGVVATSLLTSGGELSLPMTIAATVALIVTVAAVLLRIQVVRDWYAVAEVYRLKAVAAAQDSPQALTAATIAQAVQDGIAAARPRRWWHRP